MSTKLDKIIKDKIAKDGPMTIDQFMALSLYDENYGFYKNGSPIGADGAFTTAPEISQMFGEMIGLYFAGIWQSTCKNKKINIIELGPGRGTLMKDFLNGTKNVKDFHKSINSINMIEISPNLIAKQKDSLKTFNKLPIQWYSAIEDFFTSIEKTKDNDNFVTFIIANEFFDALPVKQFNKENKERKIILNKEKNVLEFSFPDKEVSKEVSPQSNDIMEKIARFLENNKGQLLVIDYGYYNNDATASNFESSDTLQAIHKHQYINPLQNIGKSDITYHVDFKNMQEIAQRFKNLKTSPTVTQGEFLEMCGIKLRAIALKQNIMEKDMPQEMKQKLCGDIDMAVKRLVIDMSKVFKVFTCWNL